MQLSWTIATLGPIGHLSAPGTVASCLTLPLVCFLQSTFPDQASYIVIVSGLSFIAFFIIRHALGYIRHVDDPTEIVLDEVIGCLITFWGIGFSAKEVIIGFLLFRFLDISKIVGIAYAERARGAWGILCDDIVAALISNMLLRFIA